MEHLLPSQSQLNNLTMADMGSYRAQITLETSSSISDYVLRIFRRLRKLQVDNHYVLSGNRTCEIHLTCSVENPHDSASFTWYHLGKQISPSRELNITINLNPKNPSEQIYTCLAENPVSNLSTSVSVQRYCKGFTKEKTEHLSIILIVIVVPVICIVIFTYLLLWMKRKGIFCFCTQRTFHPVEPTGTIEYASVSPENTVYAQVSHPIKKTEIPRTVKGNDSTTIYCTVQQPKSESISSRATALDSIIQVAEIPQNLGMTYLQIHRREQKIRKLGVLV
ncbi:SLAM family member 6 [Tamandua tetradactyla]|uniref:SLAM family member 6 n=1 Tax=Tamandua tetradactyla TaxID=48850 RepID=UPI004054851C